MITKDCIDESDEFMKSMTKNSLDEKIIKRLNDYKSGEVKPIPFNNHLFSLREKLVSQILK